MVTSDDEATTDIIVEGDQEEITRMTKELTLQVSTRLHEILPFGCWLVRNKLSSDLQVLTRTYACRKRARCA